MNSILWRNSIPLTYEFTNECICTSSSRGTISSFNGTLLPPLSSYDRKPSGALAPVDNEGLINLENFKHFLSAVTSSCSCIAVVITRLTFRPLSSILEATFISLPPQSAPTHQAYYIEFPPTLPTPFMRIAKRQPWFSF